MNKRIETMAILALFVGLIVYISSQSESVRDRNHRWKEEVMYSTDVPRITEILDAMEKASKILLDPEADEDDKRWARKALRKTLDELLGKKETDGEKSLQDVFDDLAKTKLADSGEIAIDLDDISEDLNKNPEKMSSEDLDKTLRDMGKLMDDIIEYAEFALEELKLTEGLKNKYEGFAEPQPWRAQTKFERKGLKAERSITELYFMKE